MDSLLGLNRRNLVKLGIASAAINLPIVERPVVRAAPATA